MIDPLTQIDDLQLVAIRKSDAMVGRERVSRDAKPSDDLLLNQGKNPN